ncbi:hypothetical protein LCGC14_0328000 [marine sediment metagenome]|uniref:Toxin co-regulated pilus biosynthesis protein Q C-terminal domain-containing protein n=1 Tax=marine sediment metagenome TaxID=412755 RepID=A0A0F9W4J8_9ZZZZ
MKHRFVVAAGVACIACASFAEAGFALHGSGVTSDEQGLMGARTHASPQGFGAFRQSPADMSARQRRLADAELLVDLAYMPVTQRGSGTPSVVEGFADEVPFPTGMSMIVPHGWQIYRDPDLKSNKIPDDISYLGGEAWPDVLAQLGDRYALQFHIDWYDRVVMMKPGRAGLLAQVERVRIIEEPKPAVVEKPQVEETNSELAADKTEKLEEGVKVIAQPEIPAAEPIKVVPVHTMLVLKGTLFENVVRLSELNGWNAPKWDIEGDYRIQADYTIKAETFQEAMAKLLLLHPIEADVNLSQRKIYVLKEIR